MFAARLGVLVMLTFVGLLFVAAVCLSVDAVDRLEAFFVCLAIVFTFLIISGKVLSVDHRLFDLNVSIRAINHI